MDPSPVRNTPPLEEDEGEWGMVSRQFPIFIFSFQKQPCLFPRKILGENLLEELKVWIFMV